MTATIARDIPIRQRQTRKLKQDEKRQAITRRRQSQKYRPGFRIREENAPVSNLEPFVFEIDKLAVRLRVVEFLRIIEYQYKLYYYNDYYL